MSQIEQEFRGYISSHPEIEKCYSSGLVNRRSLARFLIKEGIAKSNQMDAVIAMLRRFEFKKDEIRPTNHFKDIKVNIKDKIVIFEFEKSKELMHKLDKVINQANYDKGDTLKIVVGTLGIKVFIDHSNEKKIKEIMRGHKVIQKYSNISEISIIFSDSETDTKGTLATIATEFSVNDIVINELLTGSPELLIYLKDEYVLQAYSIIRRLKS